MSSPMVVYRNGPRSAVQHVPASSVNAGDVIVLNDLAYYADVDNPNNAQDGIRQMAVYVGGIVQGVADNAYPNGTYVFWDPVGQKFTTAAAASAVPFGWIVAGPNGLVSDGGPTGSGSACWVLHDPIPSGDNITYNLGATANDNISNTGSETAFATTAVIPAGTLQAGDVVHVRAVMAVLAQNSTNTNAYKLKISTALNTFTAVVTAGAKNLAANGLVVIDGDFVFTAVGNSGSYGFMGIQLANDAAGATSAPVQAGPTTINTNLAVTIEVTDTQSAANTGNNAQLQELEVTRKRK